MGQAWAAYTACNAKSWLHMHTTLLCILHKHCQVGICAPHRVVTPDNTAGSIQLMTNWLYIVYMQESTQLALTALTSSKQPAWAVCPQAYWGRVAAAAMQSWTLLQDMPDCNLHANAVSLGGSTLVWSEACHCSQSYKCSPQPLPCSQVWVNIIITSHCGNCCLVHALSCVCIVFAACIEGCQCGCW